MANDGTLRVRVVGDVGDFQSKMSSAEGVFGRFGAAGVGAVAGIGASIASAGIDLAVGAIRGAFDQVGAAIDLASDKAEAASKAQILFGDSYELIDQRSRAAAESVGLSSGRYIALAGDVGNLVTNFGIAGDEAANMSGDIVQLAADMGSFNNANTDEVVQAIGAAFRGETEPIRRFGVMLDAATISAKAVEMGLADSTKAVSTQDKALATYQLILEQTSEAQGDFARTSDGFANSQRINAAKQEEAWTRIGEAIKPLAQGLNNFVSDTMTGVLDIVGDVAGAVGDWIDDNQELLTNIRNLVSQGIDVLFDGLSGLWEFIRGPLGTALDLLGAAFDFVGKAVGFFVDAIRFGVDGLHNLHRAIDPNMAALEDAQTQFRDMALEAGLSADRVDEAWQKAAEAARAGQLQSAGDFDQFIEDFKAAGTASHDDFASRVTESGQNVIDIVANMGTATHDTLTGMADDANVVSEEMATAIGRIPEEFQAFVTDAGLSVDQINEMAKSMPRVWGEEAVKLKAALDQLPPELRSVAEKAGLSVDQINEWIATLPPEALAAAKGVEDAADDIKASLSEITGALGGLGTSSDDAWKAFKKSTKEGKEDVSARIDELSERLRRLNSEDLSKLGPNALAAWAEARSATESELIGLQAFVDNKGDIIAGLLPDAVQDSVSDNRTAWENAFGVVQDVSTDVQSQVGTWGYNVGDTWAAGVARAIRQSRTQIANAIPRGMLEGFSPPREGPLRNIDKWGENIGRAWVEGIVAAVGTLRDRFSLALGGAGAAALMPIAVPAGGNSSSVYQGSPITVNAYGQTPDDVQRQIERARQREALQRSMQGID